MEMKKLEPEWTPEQIVKIRQIHRKGGTVEDVMAMLGTALEYRAVRQRAAKLGIKFLAINKTHDGKSKLYLTGDRC
jgi:hypothetical protein